MRLSLVVGLSVGAWLAGCSERSTGQGLGDVPSLPQETVAAVAEDAPASPGVGSRPAADRGRFPAAGYAKLLNSSKEKSRDRGMRRMLARHADHPEVSGLLIAAINTAMQSNTVTETTLWMVQTLGKYDQPEVIDALLGWLKAGTEGADAQEPVFEIIETLGQFDKARVHDTLLSLLAADDPRVVILVTDVLGQQRPAGALEPIKALAQTQDYRSSYGLRFSVLNAISRFEGTEAADFLVSQLPSLGGQLKFLVVDHLTRMTGQPFGANVQQWVQWWAANRQSLPQPKRVAVRSIDYVWDYPVPTFYNHKVYGTQIVFVIDISTTMRQTVRGGLTRLDQAKNELEGAISRLPASAMFNVIAFNHYVQPWRSNSVPATAANKLQAIRSIRTLQAGSGTAIYDGLDMAMQVHSNIEAIYLLTDGLPTAGRVVDERQILRIVTRENRFRKISINTIAVGRESELLLRMSQQNFGSYRRSG